jgi:hypothetical protein
LKQGDASSSKLFNFALEHAIRMLQVDQDDLKLKGTHQYLVYANDVNVLGGIYTSYIRTVKQDKEALLVASKETGLEVNVDTTKYIVRSRNQNVGRSQDL